MRRRSSLRTRCFMWTDPLRPFRPAPQPLNRREMLTQMCTGFGMLGLASLAAPLSAMGSVAGVPRLPHFTPRAKRVVFLFLNGGPSHVDTLDPKPALARMEGQQPNG